MNEPRKIDDDTVDEECTLDPPGSIAVVGAGALGIEAALYGRYLGYNVTVLEAAEVGQSMRCLREDPLPMLPDRCLSPLAVSALAAQGNAGEVSNQEGGEAIQQLPMTCGQWIDDVLVPLSESDLLRGRLRTNTRVVEIIQIAATGEDEDEENGDGDEQFDDIPPDFRLMLSTGDPTANQVESMDAEALILAVGFQGDIKLGFTPPVPYFVQIGATSTGDPEMDFLHGLREIVGFFAALGGRSDLDLYRPRRF